MGRSSPESPGRRSNSFGSSRCVERRRRGQCRRNVDFRRNAFETRHLGRNGGKVVAFVEIGLGHGSPGIGADVAGK